MVCSRCQQPARGKKPATDARICDEGIALDEQPAGGKSATATAPFQSDDWPARQRARSLARELKRPSLVAARTTAMAFGDRRRFEPPQDPLGQFDLTVTASTPYVAPASTTSLQSRRTEGSQVFAWLIVLVGTIALVGGVGLIAWSLSTKQMPYWNLALGLALGGQGTLILGLVLVVSRLWRHSRYAAGKLQDVHARLGQLQHTAEILTTTRAGGGAPAFYADLARSASPHMLLANLKGQLDQLATRLG
jgi:hypothetical protein